MNTIDVESTEVIETPKEIWFFSLSSAELQKHLSDEIKNLPNYMIPLKQKPDKNCRKCFNRLHIGKNLKNNLHVICPHCAKKYVDFELYSKMTSAANPATIPQK